MTDRRGTDAADRPPRSDALTWADQLTTVSPLPVLLLEVPSEKILAASESAVALLSDGADRPVVGQNLEDFTEDLPSGALDLVQTGRLAAYEATRIFTVGGRPTPFHLWIRPVDPPQALHLVFVVIAQGAERPERVQPEPGGAAEGLVLGATNQALAVDRVSGDVQSLIGWQASDVLGRSVLQFVDPADVGILLSTLAAASVNGTGGTARVRLGHRDGSVVRALVLVVPLLPHPSCGFGLVADPGFEWSKGEVDVEVLLRRVVHETGIVSAPADPLASTRGRVPSLARLSDRELEIVRRLASGDRVPAIARSLFLSQSTVRNYLSSVFRKLGVGSQQELLDLLKRSEASPGS